MSSLIEKNFCRPRNYSSDFPSKNNGNAEAKYSELANLNAGDDILVVNSLSWYWGGGCHGSNDMVKEVMGPQRSSESFFRYAVLNGKPQVRETHILIPTASFAWAKGEDIPGTWSKHESPIYIMGEETQSGYLSPFQGLEKLTMDLRKDIPERMIDWRPMSLNDDIHNVTRQMDIYLKDEAKAELAKMSLHGPLYDELRQLLRPSSSTQP
jgi:hypothetical protein